MSNKNKSQHGYAVSYRLQHGGIQRVKCPYASLVTVCDIYVNFLCYVCDVRLRKLVRPKYLGTN